MNWYYVENGQQAGPVEDSQLASLVQAGRLHGETLVWHEGMPNWQAFSTVCPPELAAVAGAAAPAGAVPPMSDAAACAECGNIFNKCDMIPHGNVFICANCKPVFMQKLAEGARINTGLLEYASFWTRFGAVFLDGLILWVVNLVMSFGTTAMIMGAARNNPGAAIGMQIGMAGIQICIGMAYEVFMIGRYGATLGKMACKIKVVTPDGGKVSYGRAFGRYFAKMLSGLTCLIGYLMAAFDKEEHRALHDRICNTRVVLK